MWRVIYDLKVQKKLAKLDKEIRDEILRYMRTRIETSDSPRRFGKALNSDFKGLWRYRVDDYRIVCRIEDDRVIVLVIALGHRKEVYE